MPACGCFAGGFASTAVLPTLEVALSDSAHPDVDDVSDGSDVASDFAHFADHAGSHNEEADRARLIRSMRDAFASLDHVDLQVKFRSRCCIMGSPLTFLRGSCRSTMRLALSECQHAGMDEDRQCRAWKLFLFLPRMLLFRNARGGLLAKGQLQERFHQFSQGRWIELLSASRDSSSRAAQFQSRRTQLDEAMVHLGELSAGRHALESAPLGPGNDQTRGSHRRDTSHSEFTVPLPDDLSRQPEVSHESLLKNLKSS